MDKLSAKCTNNIRVIWILFVTLVMNIWMKEVAEAIHPFTSFEFGYAVCVSSIKMERGWQIAATIAAVNCNKTLGEPLDSTHFPLCSLCECSLYTAQKLSISTH